MNYKLYTTILLRLVIHTAAQFPAAGQYAYPQMSAPISGPMGPMPGPIQMQIPPGVMHMGRQSMNLNSPFQIPQQRLPVVVMPYRSKASDRKHRRRKRVKRKFKDSTSSASSESNSSSREYALRSRKKERKRRRKQTRQILTPVISYVTRNGDIIYQKKVKKNKAGDWLDLGRGNIGPEESMEDMETNNSQEMTVGDLKQKFDLKSKRRKHRH